jgi:hypothetical protein
LEIGSKPAYDSPASKFTSGIADPLTLKGFVFSVSGMIESFGVEYSGGLEFAGAAVGTRRSNFGGFFFLTCWFGSPRASAVLANAQAARTVAKRMIRCGQREERVR